MQFFLSSLYPFNTWVQGFSEPVNLKLIKITKLLPWHKNNKCGESLSIRCEYGSEADKNG